MNKNQYVNCVTNIAGQLIGYHELAELTDETIHTIAVLANKIATEINSEVYHDEKEIDGNMEIDEIYLLDSINKTLEELVKIVKEYTHNAA